MCPQEGCTPRRLCTSPPPYNGCFTTEWPRFLPLLVSFLAGWSFNEFDHSHEFCEFSMEVHNFCPPFPVNAFFLSTPFFPEVFFPNKFWRESNYFRFFPMATARTPFFKTPSPGIRVSHFCEFLLPFSYKTIPYVPREPTWSMCPGRSGRAAALEDVEIGLPRLSFLQRSSGRSVFPVDLIGSWLFQPTTLLPD